MTTALKEYVVTLRNYDDLEAFYQEMENTGSTGQVPFRAVKCVHRRLVSRSTHYMLRDEEVAVLLTDPRVESVSNTLKNLNGKPESHFSQTSAQWNKGATNASGDVNWGLLRSTLTDPISGWSGNQTATVNVTGSGKNVDVVICDETVFPDHIEFSGRVQDYDWFGIHNETVWPDNPLSTYDFTDYTQYNNHATHIAGTVAGITQGWARDANIYNIKNNFNDQPNADLPIEYVIDYIRAFHNAKTVNPETGVKNPTLVNCSWGLSYNVFLQASNFPEIYYQGAEILPEDLGNIPLDTGYSGWATTNELLGAFRDELSDPTVVVGTTTASASIDASSSSVQVNGSVASSNLTGRIAIGDYVTDAAGNFPLDARIIEVDDSSSTITFKISFGAAQTFGSTSTAELTFYNSVLENASFRLLTTGSINNCSALTNTLVGSAGMTQLGVRTYNSINAANATVTVTGTDDMRAYGVFEVGQEVTLSNVTGITGLTANTTYYAFAILATSFRLATSPANATAGTAVSGLSGSLTGTGTATFTPSTFDETSISSEDDAAWRITAPWTVAFNGQNHTYINVSSNSYVTFGPINSYTSSRAFAVGPSAPLLRKIMISSGDRSFQKVFYSITGTAGSRLFRIRFEGYDAPQGGVAGSPNIEWEMVFHEATINQIDVHIGTNAASRAQFTSAQLQDYGILQNGEKMPLRNASIDADIADAIDDGIIFVGSAGNDNWLVDAEGGVNYNNYLVAGGLTYYYHRGTSPGRSVDSVLNVGSLNSSATETKSVTSNSGPGVDLYAAGERIISSVYDTSAYTYGNTNKPVGQSANHNIQSFSRTDNIATIVTATSHGLSNGNLVTTYLDSDPSFIEVLTSVTYVSPTSFRYSNPGDDVASTPVTGGFSDYVVIGYAYQQFNGSSSAAAQVSGVLAIALESYPRMTQLEAKEYIMNYAQTGKITDSDSEDYLNTTSLRGGENKVLYYYKERQTSGSVFPKINYKPRPVSGMVFPRPRIFRSL